MIAEMIWVSREGMPPRARVRAQRAQVPRRRRQAQHRAPRHDWPRHL